MTQIRFLGHSAFQVQHNDITLLFDPWVTGNPLCPLTSPDEITQANYIFMTHDHGDHGFADAVAIAKRLGSRLAAVNELAALAETQGVAETLRGNLGGSITTEHLTLKFTRAHHSCTVGAPCGFIVDLGEFVIYYAGDTDFFSDMAYLCTKPIDVAFLPIGSCFTMGPEEAVMAVEKIQPKVVIPMHYNTFPVIEQDPLVFTDLVGNMAEVIVLAAGEETKI